MRGEDVSGLAVHVAARIMRCAVAGETLVSETTRRAALGSPQRFAQVRTTELKGLPGHWTLHRSLAESDAPPTALVVTSRSERSRPDAFDQRGIAIAYLRGYLRRSSARTISLGAADS
jgi:hypothetical protein